MSKGAFIVIEGADGVGKQTQCELLRKRLIDEGDEAKVFSFHRYDTLLGKICKAHLVGNLVLAKTEGIAVTREMVDLAPRRQALIHPIKASGTADAMMFQCLASADKYEGAVEILEFIESGGVAICDRWWQSSYAYGKADGLDGEWLTRLHACLPKADVNLLIELPYEVVRTVRKPIPDDHYEADVGKQQEVRRQYERLWDSQTHHQWRLIDGTGAPDEVHARIWSKVIRAMAKKAVSGGV